MLHMYKLWMLAVFQNFSRTSRKIDRRRIEDKSMHVCPKELAIIYAQL